jgi:hypothetical protein
MAMVAVMTALIGIENSGSSTDKQTGLSEEDGSITEEGKMKNKFIVV